MNLAVDADDPVLGFAVGWLRSLAARVDELDVITMRAGRYELPDNVRVYSLGKERGYSEPRRLLRFYRLTIGLHPDRCFAHMAPLFALLAAPVIRAPITLWYAHSATPRTVRAAEKVVDRILTPTPESFRVKSKKVTVTGHGIDTDLFAPGPREASDCLRIVSVGRIAPVKRLEVLVEAVRLLPGRVDLRLVGPVQDPAYAESLGVQLAGPRRYDEVVHDYRWADVLVNLSETGSADKAVLEAMACGTAVVTSNEGFRSVLPVVPREPAAIAEAILKARAGLRDVVVRDHSLRRLVDEILR
jgi:glycosyltransferase involved in cell wall biosynthesis